MKSIIIIILMTFFINISCAQENITPHDKVLNAFTKMYPEAEEIEWEKEGAYFEAEFIKDGYEISVVLDEEGNILGSKKERVEGAVSDEDDNTETNDKEKEDYEEKEDHI